MSPLAQLACNLGQAELLPREQRLLWEWRGLAGETKPGLHGLNLDVLQALFRKGTHHSGQCTNHSLEWVVLDPKQLPFSYKKLKHNPVGVFRLFFFNLFFPPLHVRERTITCHVVMGRRNHVHWVTGTVDSRGRKWQQVILLSGGQHLGNKALLGTNSSLGAAVCHPWLLCQRGATWHVVNLFGCGGTGVQSSVLLIWCSMCKAWQVKILKFQSLSQSSSSMYDDRSGICQKKWDLYSDVIARYND